MKITKPLLGLITLTITSTLVSGPFAAQPPDLSRLVVVGDSLLAGFRNSSLRTDWQADGIAAVVARQAGVRLAQPLIAFPGIPAPLEQVDPTNPLAIVQGSGISAGRVDLTTQPFNLAVPGHTVGDALDKRPELPVDSLTDLILGLPGLFAGQVKSQVEWAEALKPTTALVWIGNNDVLNAAIAGDLAALTIESAFTNQFSILIDRLAATGAQLFVANLPDVAVIPYVVPIPAIAQLLGLPVPIIQGALGVTEADFLTLSRVPDAIAVLQGKKAGPLKGPDLLDAGEVAAIRAATAKYNAFITAKCSEKGARLVDMHNFLNQLVTSGVQTGNKHLRAHFLGGIFSLDGIHPTQEGAAVTANEFIRVLNEAGAAIPPVVWLAFRRDANAMLVSWPAVANHYALQSSWQAGGPWETGQFPTSNENGQITVRVPIESGARFFRLAEIRTQARTSQPNQP